MVVSIPLGDDAKRKIIKALHLGLKKDVSEFRQQFPLRTKNGLGFLRWDMINTNLYDLAVESLIPLLVGVDRGRWEMTLLFDSETSFLYSFMNIERLEELSSSPAGSHYLAQLCLINDYGGSRHRQMTFFDEGVGANGQRLTVSQIIPEPSVKRYVTVCFRQIAGDITSVVAYILDSDLTVLHKEDWSSFISPDYEDATGAKEVEAVTAIDEDEIPGLGLRKQKDGRVIDEE